jgi:signal transduction histidine kinase
MGLDRDNLDQKSRGAFEEIEAAANTMDKLVQDLLLLARFDEGQLGRQKTELLLSDVLQSSKKQVAESERIRINLQDDGLTVTGNEAELVRLFRNLMENAVLYSPAESQVIVESKLTGSNAVITVSDSGSGIAPEHLAHLGERFYRVDVSRTRPTGGTGLGLSICKSIVEAHNGAIEFESVPGRGTTVKVTLPV